MNIRRHTLKYEQITYYVTCYKIAQISKFTGRGYKVTSVNYFRIFFLFSWWNYNPFSAGQVWWRVDNSQLPYRWEKRWVRVVTYCVNRCLDSVDWNGGMEWWNRLDWTGMEWNWRWSDATVISKGQQLPVDFSPKLTVKSSRVDKVCQQGQRKMQDMVCKDTEDGGVNQTLGNNKMTSDPSHSTSGWAGR